MSRMVVVTLPEDQVNQLEFLAKEESKCFDCIILLNSRKGASKV